MPCLSLRTLAGSPGFLSVLAIASLLAAPTARGLGLTQDGAGGRAAGMGGLGATVADDPLSALFNNPAALADLGTRPTVQAGGMAGFVDGYFTKGLNDRAYIGNVGGIGQIAASFPVGPVTFALGLNPDIAAKISGDYYDSPSGPGQGGFVTHYDRSRNTAELLLLRSGFGASYRVAPNFSIGLTVGLLYNVNELRTDFVFQSQPVLRGLKVPLNLYTDGFGYNFQAGFRWRPIPSVTLNATYTSRSQVQSHGRATGNANAEFVALGAGGTPAGFAYDAEVTNDFPQSVSAGVEWKGPIKGLTVAGEFDWINWSEAFDQLPVHLTGGTNVTINGLVGSGTLNDRVPLRWRDSYVGRFGVEQEFCEHWAVRAGYAYGSHPTPADTLTPLTADISEHLLSAGVGYRAGRFRVDAAYQWQIPATGRVGRTALATQEYSNSVTELHIQVINVTAAVSF